MKKWICLALALIVCLSLCACGKGAAKDEAVQNVISMINSLANVALSSSNAIESAEEAYAALTDKQKAAVTNYNLLTNARATYDRVMNVFSLIEAIGAVTQESEAAIFAAEEAYDSLPERDRKHITNYEKLTAARAAFNAIGQEVTLDKDNFDIYFDIKNDCGVDTSEASGNYSTEISGNIIVTKSELLEAFENVSATIRVHYSVGRIENGNETRTLESQDVSITLSEETGSGSAPFSPGTFTSPEDYPSFQIQSYEVLSASGTAKQTIN